MSEIDEGFKRYVCLRIAQLEQRLHKIVMRVEHIEENIKRVEGSNAE